MNNPASAILINGEAGTSIEATDRGLLFGDGVFETIAIHDTVPRFWARHMARLQAGCHRLGIASPDITLLRAETDALLEQAEKGRFVLKIIVTRGAGTRGYRTDPAVTPTRIVQLHDWPELPVGADGIRATLCSMRLGNNPQLAGIKHLNRLEQVLARAEWDDPNIREGLLLDQGARVIEGTMSNLFMVNNGILQTPNLARCGVAGIMRDVILELAAGLEYKTRVCDVTLDGLFQAEELFVCNSLIDIWPIVALDSNQYPRGPVTARLQSALQDFNDDRPGWRA